MIVTRIPHSAAGQLLKRRRAAGAAVTLIAAFVMLAVPSTAHAATPFYCDDTGCYAYVNGVYVQVGGPLTTPPDVDNDGYANTADNCPSISNPSQQNSDTDEQGNACDADDDDDTVLDANDACPTVAGTATNGCPPPLQCGGKNTTITGTPGSDTLTGTSGVDVIAGLGGNDQIKGGSGNDIICGGDATDTIDGGSGDDRINGDAGNDTITGGSNNDTLDGGSGADHVNGGSDKDNLTGGTGSPDRCDGGSGTDSGGSGCETAKSIH